MCTHQTGEGIMSSIMTLKNKKKIYSDIQTGETVGERQTNICHLKRGRLRGDGERERDN